MPADDVMDRAATHAGHDLLAVGDRRGAVRAAGTGLAVPGSSVRIGRISQHSLPSVNAPRQKSEDNQHQYRVYHSDADRGISQHEVNRAGGGDLAAFGQQNGAVDNSHQRGYAADQHANCKQQDDRVEQPLLGFLSLLAAMHVAQRERVGSAELASGSSGI